MQMTTASGDDAENGNAIDPQIFEDPERAREHIKERIADWLERLSDLRRMVEGWATKSGGLQIVDAAPVSMHEDLMAKYAIPPVKVPAFSVQSGGKQLALFRPHALWTVGANGRVDIFTPTEAPILVDLSERLAKPSQWTLFDRHQRTKRIAFTQDEFDKLVHKQ
jgi:hypothetical protein